MGIISTADPWTRTVGITGTPTHRNESPQKGWNPWGMEVPFGNPQMNAMNGFGRVQGYGSGSKWFTTADYRGHSGTMELMKVWSYRGQVGVLRCVSWLHHCTSEHPTRYSPAPSKGFFVGTT